jgi:SAM-dependent methyltransferase
MQAVSRRSDRLTSLPVATSVAVVGALAVFGQMSAGDELWVMTMALTWNDASDETIGVAAGFGSVRALLKRSPVLVALVKVLRLTPRELPHLARVPRQLLARRRTIARYLASHKTRKLQIGAGPVNLDGWLSGDIHPRRPDHIFLDATGRFPFPARTFHYVAAEHVIQDLPYPTGCQMLRECCRVLRSGGRLRLSTPDLRRLIALYDQQQPLHKRYIEWRLDGFAAWADAYLPGFVLNDMMHAYAFLYDEATLRHALERSGFTDVTLFRPGQSSDPALRGIEQHGRVLGDEDINSFESIVVEAVKP